MTPLRRPLVPGDSGLLKFTMLSEKMIDTNRQLHMCIQESMVACRWPVPTPDEVRTPPYAKRKPLPRILVGMVNAEMPLSVESKKAVLGD